MKILSFRKDINGLRAIGVLAVIIFHFNSAWLPGGFAGVDVFFVISGYLMTGLIVSGLVSKDFSLTSFYFARARRIIPALAILCFVLLVLGWFMLAPGDYKVLAKHVEKSLIFTSNITYFKEAGYFDLASHKKWLLHTWSLSVEWQFYVIYPLVLLFCNRVFGLNYLRWIILIATVASFVFSVFKTQQNPSEAFYLLPYRAWEMMLGGLVFLFPITIKASLSKYFEYLGLVLVCSALIFISSDQLWPGALAVIPVIGTALVLIARRNSSLITSNFVSQKIGNISYSLYLWHWPVYAVIYYLERQNNLAILLLGIIISFVLGALSYYGVERRALFINSFLDINSRRPGKKVLAAFVSAPVIIMLVVFIGGKLVRNSDGAAERLNSYVFDNPNLFLREPKFSGQCHENAMDLPQCVLADGDTLTQGQPDFILLGDSHADVVSTAIAQSVANIGGKGVLLFTKGGCLFVTGIRNTNKPQDTECSDLVEKTAKIIQNRHAGTPIIIVNRLSYYFKVRDMSNKLIHFAFLAGNQPKNYSGKTVEQANADVSSGYVDMVCSLSKGRDVFIMMPTPEFGQDVVDQVAKSIMLNDPDLAEVFIDKLSYYRRNDVALNMLEEAENRCGAILIDPIPALCDKEKCFGTKDGLPLYQDDNHLNEYGNKLLIPTFEAALRSKKIQNE